MAGNGLDRKAAKLIVNALRRGVPPRGQALELTVGRDREIDYFSRKLDEVAETGLSDVKFISAEIGGGKSHFLDILETLAKERNFVVSKVDLESRSTRFDHFEEVYRKLVGGIATEMHPNDGLTSILETWARQYQGATDTWIFAELRQIPELPAQLRSALLEYGKAVAKDEGVIETLTDLISWISGEKVTAAQRKRLNVTAPIGRTNAAEMLRGLMGLFRVQGHSGFVVLLDEAESITSLMRVQDRNAANENIRSIIDGADENEGFYFVFATTPSFLDPAAIKGAATYQALWRRISDPLAGRGRSLDRVIIELPALTEAEYAMLAVRIKEIAEIGVGKPSQITAEQLGMLATYAQNQPSGRVSTLVRAAAQLLSDSYENPEFDFESEYIFVVEEAAERANDEV
jgi:P-loop Domain of unknown function (DUF2791)